MEMNYAQRLIDADRCGEAQPRVDHVIAVLDRKMKRDLPVVMIATYICDVKANRIEEAVAKLERGREACAVTGCEFPDELAFELAKVLYDTGRDRARARVLAAEAAKLATANGATELLAEIEAWRKAHR
jgi:hypothetical protein